MAMTLAPVQGKDYETKVEAIEAFNGEQSFINEDGAAVTRCAVEAAGETEVRIRYHQNSRVVILEHSEHAGWVMP